MEYADSQLIIEVGHCLGMDLNPVIREILTTGVPDGIEDEGSFKFEKRINPEDFQVFNKIKFFCDPNMPSGIEIYKIVFSRSCKEINFDSFKSLINRLILKFGEPGNPDEKPRQIKFDVSKDGESVYYENVWIIEGPIRREIRIETLPPFKKILPDDIMELTFE
ncbi:MAG: hypothetical protein NTU44_16010 [Bacteroidetes bacterium]|nr:hypothetical protein [Bacteroidota bacterium]